MEMKFEDVIKAYENQKDNATDFAEIVKALAIVNELTKQTTLSDFIKGLVQGGTTEGFSLPEVFGANTMEYIDNNTGTSFSTYEILEYLFNKDQHNFEEWLTDNDYDHITDVDEFCDKNEDAVADWCKENLDVSDMVELSWNRW